MTTIVSIVEGDGEVQALPVLLRRIGQWLSPDVYIAVNPPIRVRKDRFLNRHDEFCRMLKLAAYKCNQANQNAWLLILLDADDDCPAKLGSDILQRANEVIPHIRVSVVIANREYEAWFIASASSLDGWRGLNTQNEFIAEPEAIRGAKEWLSVRIKEGKYREVSDQPAFSAHLDLGATREKCRSFRKLCDEWNRNVLPNPIDTI